MNKKSQQGIALIWVIIAGAVLIVGVGRAASKRAALKVKESQPEMTPTATPTTIPSPTPTATPLPSSKPQGLPPGFLDWTTNKNWLPQPPGNIGKDIQESAASYVPSAEQIKKMSSLGKQPEYPGEEYTPPSVEVFNLDMEKFKKGALEGINEINKQSQEEMKKRLEGQ